MKHVRFYLEFETTKAKHSNTDSGNVFAAFVGNGRTELGGFEGLGGIFNYPNSPVGGTSCSAAFLKLCKRIPESRARAIHPALFDRLDDIREMSKPEARKWIRRPTNELQTF